MNRSITQNCLLCVMLLVSALIANTQAMRLKLQVKHIINVATQNTKLVLKVVNCRLGTHFKNGITVANLTSFVFSITHNGSRLGEVGDFENETLKLLLNLN
jgi:hypothetical protein